MGVSKLLPDDLGGPVSHNLVDVGWPLAWGAVRGPATYLVPEQQGVDLEAVVRSVHADGQVASELVPLVLHLGVLGGPRGELEGLVGLQPDAVPGRVLPSGDQLLRVGLDPRLTFLESTLILSEEVGPGNQEPLQPLPHRASLCEFGQGTLEIGPLIPQRAPHRVAAAPEVHRVDHVEVGE